jgi:hypothetical protein
MKSNLLISGNTNEVIDWNIDAIIGHDSKQKGIEQMLEYEFENRIARNGMTYLEIEQLNNLYSIK